MRCPFCQNPVAADAAECAACRLSFPRTCALVGAVPRLSPGVADTTGTLRKADHSRLLRKIGGMQRRFPQLAMQVVIHQFPAEHPFAMHVFWLFNAASFAGDQRRGKDNHALLLALDPGRGESAIMPGYGLEPLINPDALDHLLELADPAWSEKKWAEGILRVLDGLDQLLESVAERETGASFSQSEF